MPSRLASIRVPGVSGEVARELTGALLEASPRVERAGPELWRADVGGWGRRGGERALVEALREAAAAAGAPGSRVGVADVAVAADAAARTAENGSPVRIVPKGEARRFLAPLPPDVLPIPREMVRTLRALGIRRIGQVAGRERKEWEDRFGPEGARLHRWARGEDDRGFRPVRPGEPPRASVEVEGGVEGLEPLLFLLRRLLDRISRELRERGRCVARLRILLLLEDGNREAAKVAPARPTRRPELLLDLCRAALERRSGEGADRRVLGLALEVDRTARARARQGRLFDRGWRDPAQAEATLSRLRARLGEAGVVVPDPGWDHRPEARNRWRAVGESPGDVSSGLGRGSRLESPLGGPPGGSTAREGAVRPVLRLLPEPRRVEVRTGGEGRSGGGPPREVWDEGGRHEVLAAEGPERLSGDWWEDPYRREYYRVCTDEGELLWIFREYRRDGRFRWWLHGWWD